MERKVATTRWQGEMAEVDEEEFTPPPPTPAALTIDLSKFIANRFTNIDVEVTGNIVALANRRTLLVYDIKADKAYGSFPYNSDTPTNAIKWNPHHNRRMILASARKDLVLVWNLENNSDSKALILRKHIGAVMDVCWSPFEETTLVSASSSSVIYSWDTRTPKVPVQKMVVPVKGTTQVSFNRKNAFLLASAFGNEVGIWDVRKVQTPVLTFTAHTPTVTSLDWSYESEYALLTGGGGDTQIKLWSVFAAKAEQVQSPVKTGSGDTPGIVATQPRASVVDVQAVIKRDQPMQQVLFAPVGQAAVTSSRGLFEDSHAQQTITMWSLVPDQGFDKVNAFGAGTARIMGMSWRATGDGGYQVASLDSADFLRLHDVTEQKHRSTGGGAPPGGSAASRDYGSTAGSESLETPATRKTPALRNDLVPVVWKFPKLQNVSASRTAGDINKTVGENNIRELIKVQALANRGSFGLVSEVEVDMAQNLLTLIMRANAESVRPSRAEAKRDIGSRGQLRSKFADDHCTERATSNLSGSDACLEHVIAARLRVTMTIPPGFSSKDELAVIQLESAGGFVSTSPTDPAAIAGEDPLDEASIKRMQEAAQDAMLYALQARQPRLEACLLRLRNELAERVRDVANKVAFRKGLSGHGDELHVDQQAKLQFDFEAREALTTYLGQDNQREVLPSTSLLSADAIVPCPRRFGATFAPNGTLVVFSSAHAVLRARTSDGTSDGSGKPDRKIVKQAPSGYPRSYDSLLDCLQKVQRFEIEEESQDGDIHASHFDESMSRDGKRGWFRSSWGYGPDHAWEGRDDDTYDGDRYSTEDSCIEEDGETLASYAQGDVTRLPISHPGHSLEPGLILETDVDDEEGETDEDATVVTDDTVEGLLPWAPKPNQVNLVDLSPFLPGSTSLAANYKLGAWPPPFGRPRPENSPAKWESQSPMFDPPPGDMDVKAGFVDMYLSSRRRSLLPSTSVGIGMPPPPAGPQRGVTATMEITGRGGGGAKRSSMLETTQIVPHELGKQKQWESSPDFKGWRAAARSGGSTGNMGWGAMPVAGSGVGEGLPGFSGGSPGRWELARTMKMHRVHARTGSTDDLVIGSPHRLLADVAEDPLRGVHVTPPRPHALTHDAIVSAAAGGGDAGTLSPGAPLSWKASAHWLNLNRMHRLPTRRRQNHPLPISGGGPSPPLDTPRLRMGVSTPASPAGAPAPASTSPPQSDFGMDIGGGQISMPVSQIGGNAMMHGDVSRSSSFSADKAPSVVVDSIAGGGPRAGQTGLGGRGYPSGSVVDDALLERSLSVPGGSARPASAPHAVHPSSASMSLFCPEALHSSGSRSRSGMDLWRDGGSLAGGSVAAGDDGSAEDLLSKWRPPSVGDLCRYNAVVAAASGRGKHLVSSWAIMADAANRGALKGRHGSNQRTAAGRRHMSWKNSVAPLTEVLLRQFETTGDPQMLASMVSVLGSDSGNGDCGELLPEGQDRIAAYSRYLTCYAERLYEWGAQDLRAEILSHPTETLSSRRSDVPHESFMAHPQDGIVPSVWGLCEHLGGDEHLGPNECGVCRKVVLGEHLACFLCRHGGHSDHIKEWFRDQPKCAVEECECNCCFELVRAAEESE